MRPRRRSDRRTNSPRLGPRGASSRRARSSTRTSRSWRARPCDSSRGRGSRSSGPWPRSSWTRRSTRSDTRPTIARAGSASLWTGSRASGSRRGRSALSVRRGRAGRVCNTMPSPTRSRSGSHRRPGGIMVNQRVRVLAVSMLVPAAIVAGCAKSPVTADVAPPPPAAAPAPERAGTATTPEGSVAPLGEVTTRPGTTPPRAPAGAPAGAGEARAPIGPARPSVAEFAARAELQDIYFDFDRYDIRPGDARLLDASAAWLRANPASLVLIEGHCDERGTDAYNMALGDRRAKATMDYLVSRGIQAERITTLSYGEERPVCREHTEACCAKNRRAHFLVKARLPPAPAERPLLLVLWGA